MLQAIQSTLFNLTRVLCQLVSLSIFVNILLSLHDTPSCPGYRRQPQVLLPTGTRDSQAELLLGESGWVQHKEGSVLYSLDVTKCMFSSGNTTVRQRMGQLDCTGETILDLYAGIGYYTLPFLVKAGKRQHKLAYALDLQCVLPGRLQGM